MSQLAQLYVKRTKRLICKECGRSLDVEGDIPRDITRGTVYPVGWEPGSKYSRYFYTCSSCDK